MPAFKADVSQLYGRDDLPVKDLTFDIKLRATALRRARADCAGLVRCCGRGGGRGSGWPEPCSIGARRSDGAAGAAGDGSRPPVAVCRSRWHYLVTLAVMLVVVAVTAVCLGVVSRSDGASSFSPLTWRPRRRIGRFIAGLAVSGRFASS